MQYVHINKTTRKEDFANNLGRFENNFVRSTK